MAKSKSNLILGPVFLAFRQKTNYSRHPLCFDCPSSGATSSSSKDMPSDDQSSMSIFLQVLCHFMMQSFPHVWIANVPIKSNDPLQSLSQSFGWNQDPGPRNTTLHPANHSPVAMSPSSVTGRGIPEVLLEDSDFAKSGISQDLLEDSLPNQGRTACSPSDQQGCSEEAIVHNTHCSRKRISFVNKWQMHQGHKIFFDTLFWRQPLQWDCMWCILEWQDSLCSKKGSPSIQTANCSGIHHSSLILLSINQSCIVLFLGRTKKWSHVWGIP